MVINRLRSPSGLVRRGMLALLIGAVASIAACDSPYTYIENTEANTFFKVPKDWRLFDENDIFSSNISSLSPQQEAATRRAIWLVAFDANPRPSVRNLLQSTRYPNGIARVSSLSDEARDVFSFQALRNLIFPIDETLGQDPQAVEILQIQDLVMKEGFRGSRIIFNIRRGENFLTVNQTGLVDLDTRSLYLLVVGCEANCYVQNQKTIEEIVKSWTVTEQLR
ncbi:MAG TPA: hypothetical protein VHI54_10010 [Actinomycetota bacterium]|nr:hypothetical protein [Actinomycetota bacterium]